MAIIVCAHRTRLSFSGRADEADFYLQSDGDFPLQRSTEDSGLALALPASAQEIVGSSLERGCWNKVPSCLRVEEGPIRRAIAQAALDRAQAPASVTKRGDGRFQVVLGAYITAAGTDIALTMYHMGTGTVQERGFGAWWQDSPVAFAATKSALSALFAYQLQKRHKTRPKAATVIGLVSTSIEASLVARTAWLASRARQGP